MTVMAVR